MSRRKSRVLAMACRTELRKQVFPRLSNPGWKEGSYSLAGLEYLEVEAANEPPRRPGTKDEDGEEDAELEEAAECEPLLG